MPMLPTERSAPKADIASEKILIYGSPKIGKSTFCSQADGAVFLATEPGLGHLDVYQVPVPGWPTLCSALGELAAGGHPYRTIVIDTVDNAWRFAEEFIRGKFGVDYEGDMEWGKGFAMIRNEFTRVLTKIAMMPYGLILTSHATQIDVETRTGKIKRAVPTIPERARKLIMGMADMILYADQVTEKEGGQLVERRIIRTKPSQFWEAGDRTGRLPETLPLDYPAFLAAYTAAVRKEKK